MSEELGKEVILQFTDITKRKADSTKNQTVKKHPQTEKELSQEEMQIKIATVKVHANKEIERFREATKTYMKAMEELSLFEGMAIIVQHLFIKNLLDLTIEPAINNKRPPGMPEEYFRQFRRDMFKSLIKHYLEEKK